MTDEQLDEPILPDDYPVYADYFYVVDGQVMRSDIVGRVRDLKRDKKAKEVRRCDAAKRGLFRAVR